MFGYSLIKLSSKVILVSCNVRRLSINIRDFITVNRKTEEAQQLGYVHPTIQSFPHKREGSCSHNFTSFRRRLGVVYIAILHYRLGLIKSIQGWKTIKKKSGNALQKACHASLVWYASS